MSVVKNVDLNSNASSEYAKALEYLLFLNPEAGYDCISKLGLSPSDFSPLEITTSEQCIDCLSTFLDSDVWVGYLLDRKDIWFLYL